ncbi:hypothetical protein CLOM_g14960 [Closterium sp. NIES-68]|nr:hypothetical protein CLOM_g14960 [Closterium sp. NIES-68]GJP70103.1 hypothetical protein CLOP_g1088 [Closterium sp. NIES-67]
MASNDVEAEAPRKVLVAIDEGKITEQMLEFAMSQLMRKDRDRLVILNVRHAQPFPGTERVFSSAHEANLWERRAREQSRQLLADLEAKAHKAGVASVSLVSTDGDPREKIVHVAKESHADLVVVGNRKGGAVSRLKHMMGSVSDYCAHHSPCPVLIFRQTCP